MTILQEMGEQPPILDSLVPIMLRSAEGWDYLAAFVALIMRHVVTRSLISKLSSFHNIPIGRYIFLL